MNTRARESLLDEMRMLVNGLTEEKSLDIMEKAISIYDHGQRSLSRFDIDDEVDLEFYHSGKIKGCVIRSIKRTKGKVKYDVAIQVTPSDGPEEKKDQKRWTVIKNVDSVFVTKD